jgi:WD40 repeat protein
MTHLRLDFRLHLLAGFLVSASGFAVIPVQEPERGKVVDFSTEVFPFLSDNCVSCHSKTTRKGGLNLESAADILKGGDSGAAAEPGKGNESMLLKAATHEDADSAMPPRDNKVKAKNLSPEQIGLLKRWIDQGAKAGSSVARDLKWQQLPSHLRSIYTVSASADGRFVACSRGSEIFVYQVSTGRELFRTTAHKDEVQSLCFSPDGRTLFSGGFRELKVWKRTGDAVARILNFGEGISCTSEDGRWLATASSNSVSVREVDHLDRIVHTFECASPVVAMEWSPSGDALAVLTQAAKLQVWTRQNQRTVSIDMATASKVMTWRRDGKALFFQGNDPLLREWEFASDQSVRERSGHPDRAAVIAHAGAIIATGHDDGTVALSEVKGGNPTKQIKTPSKVIALALAIDAKRVAVAGGDAVLRVFDLDGKLLFEANGDPSAAAAAEVGARKAQIEELNLAFHKDALADAEKAAAAAKDRVKKSGDALKTKTDEFASKEKARAAFPAQVESARKSLSEAEFAAKGGTDSVAKLEADRDKVKSALENLTRDPASPAEAKGEAEKKLSDALTALESAQGAQKKLDASLKGAQEAVDVVLKKEVASQDELQKAQAAKVIAENELQLAIAEEKSSAESALRAKNELTRQEGLRKNAVDESAALTKASENSPAISFLGINEPAGVILLGHMSGLVQVLSLNSGLVCAHFRELCESQAGSSIRSVRWREGDVLAAAQDGRAIQYQATPKWALARTMGNGEDTALFRDRVLSLAVSQSGRLLAVGGGDPSREGDVLVWSLDALESAPKRFVGVHSDTVLGLAFSPDEKFLVSGGADKVARVLDILGMRVVRSLEGHTHHVLGVSWSPDGRSILTAGADNTVKVWDALNGTRKKSVDGADKEVTAVQFLGAGAQFVAASGDGKVRVIAPNGTVAKTISEATFINTLNAAPSGKIVFGGGDDGILRLWNPSDGSKIAEFK